MLGHRFADLLCGLAIALCLITLPAAADQGYYKWTDARGNPHASDRPPPAGVEYEFVVTSSGLKRRAPAEKSSGEDYAPDAPAVPQPLEKQPAVADTSAAIEKDPALCQQAKSNLQSLEGFIRVRIRDENGVRWLTEEDKAAQRKRAEDLIAVHCE